MKSKQEAKEDLQIIFACLNAKENNIIGILDSRTPSYYSVPGGGLKILVNDMSKRIEKIKDNIKKQIEKLEDYDL
jgi:hypothetical protein